MYVHTNMFIVVSYVSCDRPLRMKLFGDRRSRSRSRSPGPAGFRNRNAVRSYGGKGGDREGAHDRDRDRRGYGDRGYGDRGHEGRRRERSRTAPQREDSAERRAKIAAWNKAREERDRGQGEVSPVP